MEKSAPTAPKKGGVGGMGAVYGGLSICDDSHWIFCMLLEIMGNYAKLLEII